MPSPFDRRGRLVSPEEFEEQKEREREERIAKFVTRAGGVAGQPRDPYAVAPLDAPDFDYEPPSPRSHDPHTLEASRARLVEAMNSRG